MYIINLNLNMRKRFDRSESYKTALVVKRNNRIVAYKLYR